MTEDIGCDALNERKNLSSYSRVRAEFLGVRTLLSGDSLWLYKIFV